MAGIAVSVVLPTYNRASTLPRAIESVLLQTFRDFELIVVDDGSTDDTPSVVAEYTGNGNVEIVPTPHRGCAAARNTGVSRARGRYIAFQDSDDEWAPQKLAVAMAALEGTAPDVGVFYSDMRLTLSDGRSSVLRSPVVSPGVFVDERTLDYSVRSIGIQSAVVKRECFDAAGGFDEALPRLIDLELLVRLADRYRFVRSPQPLVTYRLGAGISADRDALVVARRHLLRKYGPRLAERRQHLAGQYFYLALALAHNGDRLASAACILRAVLLAPLHARALARIVAADRSFQRWATVSTAPPADARLVAAGAGAPDTGRDAT